MEKVMMLVSHCSTDFLFLTSNRTYSTSISVLNKTVTFHSCQDLVVREELNLPATELIGPDLSIMDYFLKSIPLSLQKIEISIQMISDMPTVIWST